MQGTGSSHKQPIHISTSSELHQKGIQGPLAWGWLLRAGHVLRVVAALDTDSASQLHLYFSKGHRETHKRDQALFTMTESMKDAMKGVGGEHPPQSNESDATS